MSGDVSKSVLTSRTRPRRLTWWQRWLLLITVPYLGAPLMLAAMQRSLIYQPFVETPLPARLASTSGQAHDVEMSTEDGITLRGWLLLARGETAESDEQVRTSLAQGRPVVVYFGGNAGNRSYRVPETDVLNEAGADVLIVDYRGYGDNPGEPSEEGLVRDARAVWRFATERQQVEPRRLVLYGESLGGGVAIRLARELCQQKTPPGGLIVRSTFSSLEDAAAYHFPWFPVRWLLIDRFRSEQYIREVTCPVLHLHGRRDTIVPLRLGQKLFAAAPDRSASAVAKRFVELPNANHNDVIETSRREVLAAIREFLTAISGR